MPNDAAFIGSPVGPTADIPTRRHSGTSIGATSPALAAVRTHLAAGNRGPATGCVYVVYRGGPANSGLDYAVVDRAGRAVSAPLNMADARAEAKRLNAPALNY
jgi:hypothetical protein